MNRNLKLVINNSTKKYEEKFFFEKGELKKVFEDKSNYSLIEIKGKELPHTFANYHNLKSIA